MHLECVKYIKTVVTIRTSKNSMLCDDFFFPFASRKVLYILEFDNQHCPLASCCGLIASVFVVSCIN